MIDFHVPAGAKVLELGGGETRHPKATCNVECGCGCGATFPKYDDRGRERKYLIGHWTRIGKPSRWAESRRKNSESKMGDNNPMKRTEVRKKSSDSHKGKKWTESQRKSILEAFGTQEYREEHSERIKKLWEDPDYRRKQEQSKDQKSAKMAHTITKMIADDPLYKESRAKGAKKAAIKMAQKWKDPDYVKKQMKGRGVRPNKLENEFLAMCENNGWPFSYVGDGELVIGGKCPDFHDGEKLLVEIYGDYWHRGQDPEDRVKFFKKHGYKCLVLWESEVRKTPEIVVSRVTKFLKRRKAA